MQNIEKLVRSLYNQFVMRDLFAKVTPGAVFLLSLAISYAMDAKVVYDELKDFEFWQWLVLVPICWLTGITIQGCGSFVPYIVLLRNQGRFFVFPDRWRQLYFGTSKDLEDDPGKYQLERIVVIREASGILFATLILSYVILHTGTATYVEPTGVLFRVFVGAIIACSSMHLAMTQAQFDFMLRHVQSSHAAGNLATGAQFPSATPTMGGQNTMLSSADAYSTFAQLVIHSESISWNRFYNYLMAMTLLILAWATLYVQPLQTFYTTMVLISICVVGTVCGCLWAALGFRGRRFLDEYSRTGSDIEMDATIWPATLAGMRPLTASRTLRDTLPFRYAGSMYLLTGIPLALSVLYVILFVASINR